MFNERALITEVTQGSAYISQVHEVLKAFAREQGRAEWHHHLTMARLVARALQLGRPTLIQTGSTRAKYCLSYLASVLLYSKPVVLVAPVSVQQELLEDFIPRLQQWSRSQKPIEASDRFPTEENFQGLVLVTPESWLRDRLENQERFPPNIPTLIDPADDLEVWTRQHLAVTICLADWDALTREHSEAVEWVRDVRVKLAKALFERPSNPYNCYLIGDRGQQQLQRLLATLFAAEKGEKLENKLPNWQKFWHQWQTENRLLWSQVDRQEGRFSLSLAPVEVATALTPVWQQQPTILIGGFLDGEATAPICRQHLGLGELTCLKFSPHRQHEHIQLYLPDRLPLPNTPEFQAVFLQQTRLLVALSRDRAKPVTVLVEDVPLKAQVGAALAAEFGSLVQVEKKPARDRGILVSGWEFWRSHQDRLPTPQLLIIATLPIPSLENPLVAARVAYHKNRGQDWFRHYLLPTALKELQRAVVPLRESQGVVALLDNRVNHRSYGRTILTALEPLARINYIDRNWFVS